MQSAIIMRTAALILVGAFITACTHAERRIPKADDDRQQLPGVDHVASIAGFRSPESVRYDPDQDVWFVSNIAGFGSDKDGRGYIVRVAAAKLDSMSVFAISGKN